MLKERSFEPGEVGSRLELHVFSFRCICASCHAYCLSSFCLHGLQHNIFLVRAQVLVSEIANTLLPNPEVLITEIQQRKGGTTCGEMPELASSVLVSSEWERVNAPAKSELDKDGDGDMFSNTYNTMCLHLYK